TQSTAPSLAVTSGTVNIADGSLSTTGNVTNSGTINLKGTGDNVNLNVGGSLTLNATSNIGIEFDGLAGAPPPGTPNGNFGAINVAGAANLNGTLTLNTGNGFTPSSGDKFNFISYGSSTGDFATVVNNTGVTFNLTHGGTTLTSTAGNAQDKWIFSGGGLWTDGTKWSRGVAPDSTMDVVIPDVAGVGADVTITVSSGANAANSLTSAEHIAVSGGALTLGTGNSSIAGTLTNSGAATFTANGSLNVNNLVLSGGTLNGSGAVTLTGNSSSWSGGTMATSTTGSTSIASGATLAVGGVTLDGRTLTNSGTINYSNGGVNGINFKNGATLNNAGQFNVLDDTGLISFVSGAVGAFNNSGTLTKSGGTGASVLSAFTPFVNTGVVNVNSGTLQLKTSATHSGAFNAGSGGTIDFNAGTHTFNA